MSVCPAIASQNPVLPGLECRASSLKLVIVARIIDVTTDIYTYYFSDYDPESCLILNYFYRAFFFLILQALLTLT